jgi:hypothetical protein
MLRLFCFKIIISLLGNRFAYLIILIILFVSLGKNFVLIISASHQGALSNFFSVSVILRLASLLPQQECRQAADTVGEGG